MNWYGKIVKCIKFKKNLYTKLNGCVDQMNRMTDRFKLLLSAWSN